MTSLTNFNRSTLQTNRPFDRYVTAPLILVQFNLRTEIASYRVLVSGVR